MEPVLNERGAMQVTMSGHVTICRWGNGKAIRPRFCLPRRVGGKNTRRIPLDNRDPRNAEPERCTVVLPVAAACAVIEAHRR